MTTETFSRRSFLAGVVASGTLSASITYLLPGGKAPRSPRSDRNRVELRLATGVDSTGALDLLVKIWQQANPNVDVTLDPKNNAADQRKEMRLAINSGQADIVSLDVVYITEFARDNLIQKLQLPMYGLGHGGFLAKALGACQAGETDGSSWAVPYTTDVGMLFTRHPVDGSAPTSLFDIVAAAPGSPQFVGQLSPNAGSTEAFVVNILEHALAADKHLRDTHQVAQDAILGADGTPKFELDRWQKALKPLADAVGQGQIVRARNEQETRTTFTAEKLRYMRNWPVHYRLLQQDGDVDATPTLMGVDNLPTGILGGSGLAIAAHTPHLEEARRFIQFLTDVPAQKILAVHGALPVTIGVYDAFDSDAGLRVQAPHLKDIRDAVDRAVPRPMIRKYQEFSDAVYRHVGDLLDGTELSQAFVEDMHKAFG